MAASRELARKVEGEVVGGMGSLAGIEHRDGCGRDWLRLRFAVLSEHGRVERRVGYAVEQAEGLISAG